MSSLLTRVWIQGADLKNSFAWPEGREALKGWKCISILWVVARRSAALYAPSNGDALSARVDEAIPTIALFDGLDDGTPPANALWAFGG